jgi:hypothetical protein
VQQLRTMSNSARDSAETCRGRSSVRLPVFNNIRRCFLSTMRRVFASVSSGAFLTPYSTWNLQTRFGLPPWPIRGAGQGIGGVALRSKVSAARLTLMRTPFVKRHPPPPSGFLLFFRFAGARRSRSSVACPDVIPGHRCTPLWLHQTLLEALSPVRASAEKAMPGSLRPRNKAVPSHRPLQKSG